MLQWIVPVGKKNNDRQNLETVD